MISRISLELKTWFNVTWDNNLSMEQKVGSINLFREKFSSRDNVITQVWMGSQSQCLGISKWLISGVTQSSNKEIIKYHSQTTHCRPLAFT